MKQTRIANRLRRSGIDKKWLVAAIGFRYLVNGNEIPGFYLLSLKNNYPLCIKKRCWFLLDLQRRQLGRHVLFSINRGIVRNDSGQSL